MKKNFINETHIEGLLYEHKLELKVTGSTSKNPNTPYIRGIIRIATDNDLLNVISVNFTYSTEYTAKGNSNPTFGILKKIIEGEYKSVMNDGKENATKLSINSSVGLSDRYNDEGELFSFKQNEGGFIEVVSSLNEDEKARHTFKTDMLITKVTRVEANEERQTPEKVVVKGAVFNFRKALLPVEFSAVNEKAMEYFEGLNASAKEPVFTKVWGRQVSKTVVKTITEESAFGEPTVREVKNTYKDFVITGAAPETYVWDDESTLTVTELQEMMANRETYLATQKKNREEYKKNKNKSNTSVDEIKAPAEGGFDF